MTFFAAFSWSLLVFLFGRALALVQQQHGRLSLDKGEAALQPDASPTMSSVTSSFEYRSSVKIRPALARFMGWHQDEVAFHTSMAKKVREHFGTGVSMLDTGVNISADHGLSILARHRAKHCPQWRDTASSSELISHQVDDSGVQHMLLASHSGELQYVAALSGRVIAEDPSVCRERPVSVLQNKPEVKLQVKKPEARESGESVPIDVNDNMVKKCVAEWHKHRRIQCSSDEELKVHVARESLIADGPKADLTVEIGSKYHMIECDYMYNKEVDASGHHEASLIVRVFTDICTAGSTEDPKVISDTLPEGAHFVHMGDTSRTRGLSWKVKQFPKVATADLQMVFGATALREEVDIRRDLPKCFPDNGKAVVRYQGTCGSCWAHTAASLAMAMICKSNTEKALAGENQRFEVSVQQLMTCNSEGKGCEGGGADQAADAFAQIGGFVKESDAPYECDGGDYFEPRGDSFKLEASPPCHAPPWGVTTCDASRKDPAWIYGQWGSMYRTSGEPAMMDFLSKGYPLWMYYDVYENFVSDIWEIYEGPAEGVFYSSHAVVGLGYGVANGIKYWLIQNSWGTDAPNSDNGFQKIKRGVNLAKIEDEAYYMRAWAEDGYVPPCFDSTFGTYVPGPTGDIIPCSGATGNNPYYTNLCTYVDASVSNVVKSQCPLACQVSACSNLNSAPPPGTYAPTPPPLEDPSEQPPLEDPAVPPAGVAPADPPAPSPPPADTADDDSEETTATKNKRRRTKRAKRKARKDKSSKRKARKDKRNKRRRNVPK